MRVYGPVPSRRLGRSLGINNIPAKHCTYSCIYCQLGTTLDMQFDRQIFYDPEELAEEVRAKVRETKENGVRIDYLSFVPDGEPTLEERLGDEIDLVSSFDIDVAVISNASLIWDDAVKSDLARADWVSLKVDAVSDRTWKRVNRPHRELELSDILEGIREFADEFDGTLATETMLIKEFNDDPEELERIASFLGEIGPDESYLAIPTRPPAELWAKPAEEERINEAYQIIAGEVEKVEYLIGYEGNEFDSTGDTKEDLLSIKSVHPMKREGVEEFLKRSESGWDTVKELISADELVEVNYGGEKFYVRKLPTRDG